MKRKKDSSTDSAARFQSLRESAEVKPAKQKKPKKPPQGPRPVPARLKTKAPTEELKSGLSAKARSALDRTKAARATNDRIIASLEPDPEWDALPVIEARGSRRAVASALEGTLPEAEQARVKTCRLRQDAHVSSVATA